MHRFPSRQPLIPQSHQTTCISPVPAVLVMVASLLARAKAPFELVLTSLSLPLGPASSRAKFVLSREHSLFPVALISLAEGLARGERLSKVMFPLLRASLPENDRSLDM